jgi:hypothetical protein
MALLQVLLGVILGYLLVTFAESFLHEHIHHAQRWFLALQKKYPRLLKPFRDAYRSHAIVHHCWTYHDHVTRFASEHQKQRVDERLQDHEGRRIIAEAYGTTLGLRSTVVFVLPILPVVLPALLLLPWPAAAGFAVPVVIYPLMSKVIHPYLHEPYREALRKAPAVIRWALSTRYMKSVWRHHWMHHRSPQSNFNLLLGGDWFRGKHRSPSAEDERQMSEVGLPLD